MKKNIFVLGLILTTAFLSLNILLKDSIALTQHDDKAAGITVTLSGNGSTNATVWVKNESTGQIFYCTQLSNPNEYRADSPGMGTGYYTAYACTNYPTNGTDTGIYFNWPQNAFGSINLSAGACEPVHE